MESRIGLDTRPRGGWSVCVQKKGKKRDEGDDGVGKWMQLLLTTSTNQQRVEMNVRQRLQRVDEKERSTEDGRATVQQQQ